MSTIPDVSEVINKPSPIVRLLLALDDILCNDRKYHLGRILTVIDACIPDTEQRKAIKDLIEEAFWSKSYYSKQKNEIILQWIEKFCPNEKPKTPELEEEFLGYKRSKLSSNQNYFSEE